jgi:hypothetical protein
MRWFWPDWLPVFFLPDSKQPGKVHYIDPLGSASKTRQ